ncbi:MAG: EscU/YscU/HrcU family type III secretion system export apparatus switch protein, partial [Burkholderiales bacterium]|nr:EscU/YscU/HrcU family type III secretion system export apparatus switch protein [Burkholderiales bacterium]
MAESQQSDLEKTEPASPRRLEQAREQGQVARSTELTSFLVLAVSGGILLFAGAAFIDGMR